MKDWIAKVTEAVILGIFTALTKPGVLVGLVNAWREAHSPQQIQASKPNSQDEKFTNQAKLDGWKDNPPV